MQFREEGPGTIAFRFPYWFAAFILGMIAELPWLHWRFSLRTLLIATTLAAVVLGLIVRAGVKIIL